MGGVLTLLILFGLAFTFGPIAAGAFGFPLGGIAAAIMIVFGIAMIIVSAVAAIITKLYVKTKADEAFVRTGMSGMKIIKDGGAVVIPVVHQVVTVPLRTFRLEVQRKGADALLTKDKLRADIKAEFFVRVQPEDEDITNAARSLGDRGAHEQTIRALIEDKLVSALRTVAAQKTLEELNSKRDEFVKTVMDAVTGDLRHNGFKLETATISALDQADTSTLRQDNVFDAEGLLTITTITEEKRTAANAIRRDREQERLGQDVRQRQEMLKLEQQKALAEAQQTAEIAQAQAEQDQHAREARIRAEQSVEQAELEKLKAVEVAKQQTEEAQQVAEQQKQQAVEVAARDREVAVVKKEQERADAEALRLGAEKKKETEAQAIETVKVEAAAHRDKKQRVIAAEAAAETQYVTAAKHADAEAYAVGKQADAKKAAAEAEAEAITKRATADATAAQQRAKGAEAEAMVPVNVKKAEVAVEDARVDVQKRHVEEVLQPELEAREAHGAAAQEFEIAKLRVTKEAEVRIAAAHAVAQMSGKVEAQVFGTPEDAARMASEWMRGMGITTAANGFFAGASDETSGAMASVATLVRALARKLGLPDAEVQAMLDSQGGAKGSADGVERKGKPSASA